MYSRDEQSAGVLAYLLRLQLNLAVECCAKAAEAAASGCELNILILTEPGEKAELQELCECLHGSSLLYDPQTLTSEADWTATAYVHGRLEPSRFLDRVRALFKQRRGPKSQAGKHSTAAVTAA